MQGKQKEIVKVNIGLAGFGVVGEGVYSYLQKNAELLSSRTGFIFNVKKILVRNADKERPPQIKEILTTSRDEFFAEPDLDVIVELIGGCTDALEIVKQSISAGKPIVTANKALLAEHGKEIFNLAEKARVPIFFEAAVAGGIPIIKVIQQSFIGNHFLKISGIINGTSNYILSRMHTEKIPYSEVLADAQKLGYAEADPTLDISGWDAAHKAMILASLAYGSWLKSADIHVRGIEDITLTDIRFASELGYKIKLLANISVHKNGGIELWVGPSLVPNKNILSSVSGAFNAIAIKGDIVGQTLFYGQGAGQKPTASSVISDVVDSARILKSNCFASSFVPHGIYGKTFNIKNSQSNFYLRLQVEDKPGVLAKIANILGKSDIGILSVIQPENDEQGDASLVLMIHRAKYGTLTTACEKISKLNVVKQKPTLLRVENE